MTVHLSRLLKKNEKWEWSDDCQRSFEGIKHSLIRSPVLAIADQDSPFYVVCDASDFATGCALMQFDTDGIERVAFYQSLQFQPAERNYLFHDKELLAIKYALSKCWVYLLGDRPFIVYTDHASYARPFTAHTSRSEWRVGCRSSRSTTSPWNISQDD